MSVIDQLDRILKNYGIDWKLCESNGKQYYESFRGELIELLERVKNE